ncbi:MAG: 6-carboxyhexanoate--CoA ligase [Chloroflexota bacterium]
MWSVRMRASRRSGEKDAGQASHHISGCEGLFSQTEVAAACESFVSRALTHPKGRADEIVVTVERVLERPLRRPLLSVQTLACESPEEARGLVTRTMTGIGISRAALRRAFTVLGAPEPMRGASLILEHSGRRVEPDRVRGVRVSRIGIERCTVELLDQMLARMRINTPTVREALTLASKVAAHRAVQGEICISDDPGYTTGYVASRSLGYRRIPHVKRRGDLRGGRVFFVREGVDLAELIAYLEMKPVLLYMP